MTDIMLSAGEASGDDLGAHLIAELKHRRPALKIAGIGGAKMRQAGMESIADNSALSVMGYWDVARRLPAILSLRRRLLAAIRARRPPLFVGIDAPDFNLSLARQARAGGAYTVLYTSPSIWMWRAKRLAAIERAANEVWCLFPFEPACYQQSATKAIFVGHPLAEESIPDQKETRRRLGMEDGAFYAALFAGSRKPELHRHLPLLRKTLALLGDGRGDIRFVAAAADDNAAAMIRRELKVEVYVRRSNEVLAASDIAVVKSGTAALQAALMQKPTVVFYKASPAAYFFGPKWRRFSLPFFSLPNILARRFVVAELLQEDAAPELLADTVGKLATDEAMRATMNAEFAQLRARLQNRDGLRQAAKALIARC